MNIMVAAIILKLNKFETPRIVLRADCLIGLSNLGKRVPVRVLTMNVMVALIQLLQRSCKVKPSPHDSLYVYTALEKKTSRECCKILTLSGFATCRSVFE